MESCGPYSFGPTVVLRLRKELWTVTPVLGSIVHHFHKVERLAMILGVAQKLHYAKFLLSEHSPTILTGVGVVGTVTTAYLTGRATVKAVRIVDENSKAYEPIYNPVTSETDYEAHRIELSKTKKAKLVWKHYIPPVGVGTATISAIILANRISAKRIAALGLAAGISERALQEYKDKIQEKLGVRQSTSIREDIAQDRVNNNPPESTEVIITGNGDVLCYDMLTGRYFLSNAETIKRAENQINFEILNHMYASLTEFYDKIGLPPTTYTDSVGWTGEKPVNVLISTTMSPDKRPCLSIDFETEPTPDYYRVH